MSQYSEDTTTFANDSNVRHRPPALVNRYAELQLTLHTYGLPHQDNASEAIVEIVLACAAGFMERCHGFSFETAVEVNLTLHTGNYAYDVVHECAERTGITRHELTIILTPCQNVDSGLSRIPTMHQLRHCLIAGYGVLTSTESCPMGSLPAEPTDDDLATCEALVAIGEEFIDLDHFLDPDVDLRDPDHVDPTAIVLPPTDDFDNDTTPHHQHGLLLV